jgi:hypothetical protein
MSTQTTKVTLALASIVALCFFHALSVATVNRVIVPSIEEAFGIEPERQPQAGGLNFDNARNAIGVTNTLPVNSSALNEPKRQTGPVPYCPPCDANPPTQQPRAPIPPPAAAPTSGKYNVSVFVLHNDPASKTVLSWFDDPSLTKFKTSTNYHVYTRDNPLYLGRFASTVPVSSFPAVLYTDPSGGYIYSFDKSSVPSSLASMKTDIQSAYNTHKQVAAQVQNTVESATNADCPDGFCPPQSTPGGFLDRFRPKPDTNPIEGILRTITRPGETLLQYAFIGLLVFVIVLLLKRRGA